MLMPSSYNLVEGWWINLASGAAALCQAHDPSRRAVGLTVTSAVAAPIANGLTMLVSAPYETGVMMHLRRPTVACPQQGEGGLGRRQILS